MSSNDYQQRQAILIILNPSYKNHYLPVIILS